MKKSQKGITIKAEVINNMLQLREVNSLQVERDMLLEQLKKIVIGFEMGEMNYDHIATAKSLIAKVERKH